MRTATHRAAQPRRSTIPVSLLALPALSATAPAIHHPAPAAPMKAANTAARRVYRLKLALADLVE